MIRFCRIPASVSKSTKGDGQWTIIGWGSFVKFDGTPVIPPSEWWGVVEHYYALNLAYVASLQWSAWSAYSDVQCGRVYSYRYKYLSNLWNGHPSRPNGGSGAGDWDVRFNIVWPSIPAGAKDVRYIVQEETSVAGVYSRHLSEPSDPGATYYSLSSPENGQLGVGLPETINPWGETRGETATNDATVCCAAWIEYLDYDGTDCDEIGVMDDVTLSDSGAILHSPIDDMPWEYGEEGGSGHSDSADGVLTGLTANTWYWFRQPGVCSKTFWFKTKKKDDDTTWTAAIITLPATEVWATGATMHGLFWYKGNSRFYVALGFEYGLGTLDGSNIHWLYTLGQSAHNTDREFKMPIQMTIAGLLPDRSYNYRACLHLHQPTGELTPMNMHNYFGQTLSFGGPVSMFGFGREYVTAKKAEDDVSRMAAGRYYLDKNGVFQYESCQRRKIS